MIHTINHSTICIHIPKINNIKYQSPYKSTIVQTKVIIPYKIYHTKIKTLRIQKIHLLPSEITIWHGTNYHRNLYDDKRCYMYHDKSFL